MALHQMPAENRSEVRSGPVARGVVTRIRRRIGTIRFRPHQMMLMGFAACIAAGTLVLRLPISSAGPSALAWTEALFTATSSVCVTGLTVVRTGADLSHFGQVTVLLLFQMGGLGIMTFSTLFLLAAGGRPSLAAMEATRESVGAAQPAETRGMLRRVVLMTAAIEAIGLLFLFTAFVVNRTADESIAAVLWSSVFHTVSAFCNAGFGLHADSLERYRAAWSVNIVIMTLIMVGGIGFPVLRDLSRIVRAKVRGKDAPRLTLHSKVVLITTGLLLAAGALGFMVTEWNGKGLAGMPVHAKIISAMFQSTTARTAGFSTVSIGALAPATLFMVVVLMFIGASPCSTGGGIKTSTVGVIGVLAISRLRGREEPCAFGRSIPRAAVTRAVTVALLAGMIVIAFIWSVMAAEAGRFGFGRVVFEVISAFGTVGLSTGITKELGMVSRLLLIALMFIGRLGPLTVVVSVARREQRDLVQYPSEQMLIG